MANESLVTSCYFYNELVRLVMNIIMKLMTNNVSLK